ncbi:hypothetical protein Acsp02_97330 [Actinoplanes sp. NBRC 103695]|nr:hypothetical protein Acsp02_97330 [Actinoplanes sp. NBRC 103695]
MGSASSAKPRWSTGFEPAPLPALSTIDGSACRTTYHASCDRTENRDRRQVATTNPAILPDKATWYLATNLPRPGGPHDTPEAPHEPADLTEVVRLYGIRHWIEQSYKQVKDELGWADFQVRSATAIRRHQTLVNCAFSFCWNTWFDPPSTTDTSAIVPEPLSDNSGERGHTNPAAGRTPQLA